ncbi:hypothetical protein D3C71_1395920 [compost metagenome]
MTSPALGSAGAGPFGLPGGSDVGAGNTVPRIGVVIAPTAPSTGVVIAPTVVPTPSSRPPTAPPTPFNNPPSALPNPFGASAIELVCTALTPASTSLGLRSAASTTWPSASTRTPPATLLASDACTASGASGVTVAWAINAAFASTSAAARRA